MRLYYTTSAGTEQEQKSPKLSLGGFKSSSPLINSQFGNMFSDISSATVNQFSQNQYIALVLKNETGAGVTGAKLWFEHPEGCYSELKVGAVFMTESPSGLTMEHIQNPQSQPLYSDFVSAIDEAHSADLGDIASNAQIGIWIERSLLPDVIKTQQAAIYEPDPLLETRFKEVILSKLDDIKIAISWT